MEAPQGRAMGGHWEVVAPLLTWTVHFVSLLIAGNELGLLGWKSWSLSILIPGLCLVWGCQLMTIHMGREATGRMEEEGGGAETQLVDATPAGVGTLLKSGPTTFSWSFLFMCTTWRTLMIRTNEMSPTILGIISSLMFFVECLVWLVRRNRGDKLLHLRICSCLNALSMMSALVALSSRSSGEESGALMLLHLESLVTAALTFIGLREVQESPSSFRTPCDADGGRGGTERRQQLCLVAAQHDEGGMRIFVDAATALLNLALEKMAEVISSDSVKKQDDRFRRELGAIGRLVHAGGTSVSAVHRMVVESHTDGRPGHGRLFFLRLGLFHVASWMSDTIEISRVLVERKGHRLVAEQLHDFFSGGESEPQPQQLQVAAVGDGARLRQMTVKLLEIVCSKAPEGAPLHMVLASRREESAPASAGSSDSLSRDIFSIRCDVTCGSRRNEPGFHAPDGVVTGPEPTVSSRGLGNESLLFCEQVVAEHDRNIPGAFLRVRDIEGGGFVALYYILVLGSRDCPRDVSLEAFEEPNPVDSAVGKKDVFEQSETCAKAEHQQHQKQQHQQHQQQHHQQANRTSVGVEEEVDAPDGIRRGDDENTSDNVPRAAGPRQTSALRAQGSARSPGTVSILSPRNKARLADVSARAAPETQSLRQGLLGTRRHLMDLSVSHTSRAASTKSSPQRSPTSKSSPEGSSCVLKRARGLKRRFSKSSLLRTGRCKGSLSADSGNEKRVTLDDETESNMCESPAEGEDGGACETDCQTPSPRSVGVSPVAQRRPGGGAGNELNSGSHRGSPSGARKSTNTERQLFAASSGAAPGYGGPTAETCQQGSNASVIGRAPDTPKTPPTPARNGIDRKGNNADEMTEKSPKGMWRRGSYRFARPASNFLAVPESNSEHFSETFDWRERQNLASESVTAAGAHSNAEDPVVSSLGRQFWWTGLHRGRNGGIIHGTSRRLLGESFRVQTGGSPVLGRNKVGGGASGAVDGIGYDPLMAVMDPSMFLKETADRFAECERPRSVMRAVPMEQHVSSSESGPVSEGLCVSEHSDPTASTRFWVAPAKSEERIGDKSRGPKERDVAQSHQSFPLSSEVTGIRGVQLPMHNDNELPQTSRDERIRYMGWAGVDALQSGELSLPTSPHKRSSWVGQAHDYANGYAYLRQGGVGSNGTPMMASRGLGNNHEAVSWLSSDRGLRKYGGVGYVASPMPSPRKLVVQDSMSRTNSPDFSRQGATGANGTPMMMPRSPRNMDGRAVQAKGGESVDMVERMEGLGYDVRDVSMLGGDGRDENSPVGFIRQGGVGGNGTPMLSPRHMSVFDDGSRGIGGMHRNNCGESQDSSDSGAFPRQAPCDANTPAQDAALMLSRQGGIGANGTPMMASRGLGNNHEAGSWLSPGRGLRKYGGVGYVASPIPSPRKLVVQDNMSRTDSPDFSRQGATGANGTPMMMPRSPRNMDGRAVQAKGGESVDMVERMEGLACEGQGVSTSSGDGRNENSPVGFIRQGGVGGNGTPMLSPCQMSMFDDGSRWNGKMRCNSWGGQQESWSSSLAMGEKKSSHLPGNLMVLSQEGGIGANGTPLQSPRRVGLQAAVASQLIGSGCKKG